MKTMDDLCNDISNIIHNIVTYKTIKTIPNNGSKHNLIVDGVSSHINVLDILMPATDDMYNELVEDLSIELKSKIL